MSQHKFDAQIGACGCSKPSIAVMDFRRAENARWTKFSNHVNRCCTHCWAHWAGPVGAVKQYTRKEWDARIETAFAA